MSLKLKIFKIIKHVIISLPHGFIAKLIFLLVVLNIKKLSNKKKKNILVFSYFRWGTVRSN